jgi:hypothetical protein
MDEEEDKIEEKIENELEYDRWDPSLTDGSTLRCYVVFHPRFSVSSCEQKLERSYPPNLKI